MSDLSIDKLEQDIIEIRRRLNKMIHNDKECPWPDCRRVVFEKDIVEDNGSHKFCRYCGGNIALSDDNIKLSMNLEKDVRS